jgi:hydrogenase-4 component B
MNDPSVLLVLFFGLCAAGAVAAAILPDRANPVALAWIGAAASGALVWAAGDVLASGHLIEARLWSLPATGPLVLTMDRLSAVFAVIAGLVFLTVSIFSAGYMERYLGHYSLKSFGVLYHALFASVVLVLIAADVLSFLLVWEAMAILSYLLVNFEHRREEATSAGYLMLAMGEAGTLAAALAFLLLAASSGSLAFAAARSAAGGLGDGARWAVFLLSFFGFGVKAGLVPTSTWLPRAHPAATGNVSALLSGALVNLGLYGIVRVNLDLLPATHVGPGIIVLIVGSVSALVGILYATTQNDMKTMLAHSSIENIGIVTTSIGAGLIFAAAGRPVLAGIAYIVALYHMGNHSLYKALLFLGAGAVDAGVGDRDMDRLGGLIRRMPWTGLFFLTGTLSIAAMPPMNGFVTEWLTLQTLLRSVELSSTAVKIVFALCGAALALTAALAVTCFVKTFAMSFLGMPRSARAERAREGRPSMTGAMGLLAVLCLACGIMATYIIPVLDRAVAPLAHAHAANALVPPFFAPATATPALPPAFVSDFHDLGAQVGQGIVPGPGLVVLHRGEARNPVVYAMSTAYMLPMLIALLGLTVGGVRLATRGRTVVRRFCWDGGLPRLLPAMTYTATGFSNPVRVVFNAVFHPSEAEDTVEVVAEHFRSAVRRSRVEVYVVDRVFYGPAARGMRRVADALAGMHHGRINAYAAYILLTLLAFLVAGRLF